MFRALADIVPSLRSDPWSRPGMTLSLRACDVLWVFGSVEEDVRARGVCSGRSGKNF